MSDFFTSPQERASTKLYDMATQGHTPYDALITGKINKQITSVRQQGNREAGKQAGDIVSRAQSSGIGFTSGVNEAIGEAKTNIFDRTQTLENQIQAQGLDERLKALIDTLHLGLGGLSKSSAFGDIIAGATTIANIGAGVGTMLGPTGFGLIGKKTT